MHSIFRLINVLLHLGQNNFLGKQIDSFNCNELRIKLGFKNAGNAPINLALT